jgi:hypothetical protein
VEINLNFQYIVEEIQVIGSNLAEKVKELIHEGNVQRVIIKNDQGHTLVEIPVTLAAIGVVAAPVLAAVSAIAGIVTKCTLVVERREPPGSGTTGLVAWLKVVGQMLRQYAEWIGIRMIDGHARSCAAWAQADQLLLGPRIGESPASRRY